MKIALHGYGRMGRAVEKVALEKGHEIVAIATRTRKSDLNGADVLIDFSGAAAVETAVQLAADAHIDLVIGTTGWNDRLSAVRARVEGAGIGCVYASNFSPGAVTSCTSSCPVLRPSRTTRWRR